MDWFCFSGLHEIVTDAVFCQILCTDRLTQIAPLDLCVKSTTGSFA